jgi:ABC-type glutathione transport system ATPase component
MSIASGHVFGLVGENGAGKTARRKRRREDNFNLSHPGIAGRMIQNRFGIGREPNRKSGKSIAQHFYDPED